MGREMIYNVEKPFTEEEVQDFKKFKLNLKALLTKGKVKVVEKFSVFSFLIMDYTQEEKNSIVAFIKNEKNSLEITFQPSVESALVKK